MVAAYVFNPWDYLPAHLPWHMGTVGGILPISNPHWRLFLCCNLGRDVTSVNTSVKVYGQQVQMDTYAPFQILFFRPMS